MGYSDNSPLQAALVAASDAEAVADAASDAAAAASDVAGAAEAAAIAVSVQRASNGSDFANKPAVLVNIGAEASINRGAVSGYAPLDVSQRVPAANAPDKSVYATGGGQALSPGDVGAEVAGAAATAEANANGYTDTQVAIVGGRVGAPVADVAALRAVASAALPDKQLRLSEDTEAIYSWNVEGVGADDGDGVIVPTDIVPPAPGRWFKTTVSSQNHEVLVGLLGGALNDHQHLTTAQLAIVNAAVVTTDPRLSDARTPIAHKASHQTGGSDSISLLGLGTAFEQGYFVKKGGLDSRSGKTPEDAMLTAAAAVAAAVTQTPAINNKYCVDILDAGIYAENITLPSWVYMHGLQCTLNGSTTLADDSSLSVAWGTIASGTMISKTAGAGRAYAKVRDITLTGSAGGVLNTSGELLFEADRLRVVDGYGVGSISTTGDLHCEVDVVDITGTGIGIGAAGVGAHLAGRINAIRDLSGGGTGILIGAGVTADLYVGEINCAGAAINCAGTLNLITASPITGSIGGAGTINITYASDGALARSAVQPGALGTAAALDVATGGTGDLLRVDGDGSSLSGVGAVDSHGLIQVHDDTFNQSRDAAGLLAAGYTVSTPGASSISENGTSLSITVPSAQASEWYTPNFTAPWIKYSIAGFPNFIVRARVIAGATDNTNASLAIGFGYTDANFVSIDRAQAAGVMTTLAVEGSAVHYQATSGTAATWLVLRCIRGEYVRWGFAADSVNLPDPDNDVTWVAGNAITWLPEQMDVRFKSLSHTTNPGGTQQLLRLAIHRY